MQDESSRVKDVGRIQHAEMHELNGMPCVVELGGIWF